jgi:hypothetical protein
VPAALGRQVLGGGAELGGGHGFDLTAVAPDHPAALERT